MKKINYLSFLIILILSLSLSYSIFAENKGDEGKNKRPILQKTLVDPSQSVVDLNQITCWVGSDGYHDWVVGGSWSGAYPNGVNFGPIFTEGIIWGGKVNDGVTPALRVNGNTYGSGCAPITRLFRVRPDYATGDLTLDAADFNDIPVTSVTSADIQSLKDQYAKDWNEWPAAAGAPYTDVDGDGQYNPSVDIPGIQGASQTLFIKYNDDQIPLYGAPPIGLEVSETYWAYATAGALGNIIFKKVDIVYAGTSTTPSSATIDSMYIVQWADPDVGNSGDDFAGCDTTLNLGYAYNSGATDATYQTQNLAPPAVGYDFLQGVSKYTGDPADSAIFNLKWRHGYKYVNAKPMSSYVYFAAGGTWSDPAFTYTGTQEFYNLMRGRKPDPPYPAGDPFPAAVADVTPDGSTYLLAGDPVFGTGKIDGTVDGPGDRRIMVTNGPITMNYKDTAQIVLALVGGLGKNNLSSISVMKYNDAFAQYAFDQLFDIPIMPKPNVQAVGLNDKIVLNWSKPDSLVNTIENDPHGSYTFEAYSVYQLPPGGTDISAGVRIATFDVVNNVQVLFDKVLDEGTGLIYTKPIVFLDNTKGLQRYLTVTQDQIFNRPLANGLSYTFAVTAIAYNNDPSLPSFQLESSPTIINVTPQEAPPGIAYGSVNGDTLTVAHETGKSDGVILPIVLDPSKTDGHDYKVTFDTLNGGYVWNLTDLTTNTVALADQTNQSGDENYQILNGILLKVIGPPIAINDVISTGTRWISGTNWGGGAFFSGMDVGPAFWGTVFPPSGYVPIELDWTDNPTPSEANGWAQGAVYWRSDSYNYHGVGWMPFKAFDISDPANPVQVNVSFVEDANNGSANLKWDMGWDGSAFAENGGREYTFIHNTPYDPTYYDATNNGLDNDNMYDLWPSARGSHPYLEAPFTMTIVPNYPNIENDKFTFSSPKVTSSQNQAKDDVKMINVFPNPYYGYQYRENSRDQHYVTFSHLPSNAVIRVFDLSGVLVRTITHKSSDVNSQFERWNLQNDSGYPVASGVYVVYIDMPDLGTTKILKLAIIQEKQILRVY